MDIRHYRELDPTGVHGGSALPASAAGSIACANLFDLLQYVLTIVVSDPSNFIIPACVSRGFIVAVAVIYSYVVWKDRGHLFHKLKLK